HTPEEHGGGAEIDTPGIAPDLGLRQEDPFLSIGDRIPAREWQRLERDQDIVQTPGLVGHLGALLRVVLLGWGEVGHVEREGELVLSLMPALCQALDELFDL